MIFSREFWGRRGAANVLLLPLSGAFVCGVFLRRILYARGILQSHSAGAPVIVVGNVVAGGGGKTPLVIALVQELQRRGFNPGVATRGTGGDFSGVLHINSATSWRQCGDEPLLIFRRTAAPVCAAKKRILAARELVKFGCDVIVCDDGLQHYALRRELEVCAVNAGFGLGNGLPLPAGPLREGARRMESCDWIVACGAGDFAHPKTVFAPLRVDGFYALGDIRTAKTAADFSGKRIAALAGIAAPRRFFDSLRAEGIAPDSAHPLPDHGRMDDRRLAAIPADIVLMTEKDAVKYPDSDPRLHCMRVSAVLPPQLAEAACRLAASAK